VTDKKTEYMQETSEPVATVLSRLAGVKRLGPGFYEADNPLDTCRGNRVLVIEGKDDRAVIRCYDGSWLHQSVSTLGLHVEDLFRGNDDIILIGSAAPKYEPPESLKTDRGGMI